MIACEQKQMLLAINDIHNYGDVDATDFFFQSIRNVSVFTKEREQEIFSQNQKAISIINAILTSDLFVKNPLGYLPVLQSSVALIVGNTEEFLYHNQRLIVSQTVFGSRKTPLIDRVQDGNLGAIDAFNSFNPQLNNKFSTWAVQPIRRAIINNSRNENNAITIPSHRQCEQNKIAEYRQNFFNKHNRMPTTEECCNELHWTSVRLARVDNAGELNKKVLSLDEPASKDDNLNTIGETLTDPENSLPQSIEKNLFSNDEDVFDQVKNCLLQIWESKEFKPNEISMYLTYLINAEDSVERVANEYGYEKGKTLGIIVRIHSLLAERLGIPMEPIKDKEYRHSQLCKSPLAINRRQKPEEYREILNQVEKVIKGDGRHKVEMYLAYVEGYGVTMPELAIQYGVRRQRVKQIIDEVDIAVRDFVTGCSENLRLKS